MGAPGVLAAIERLDPDVEYERISYLSTNFDFPWDVEQSLSLAFFKTYGIPTIGELLDRRASSGPGRRSATTTRSSFSPRSWITA